MNCSLYVEEDNDAGDVVDRGVFFLPSLDGFFDYGFCCLFSRVVLVMWHDDVCSFLIADELPDTI